MFSKLFNSIFYFIETREFIPARESSYLWLVIDMNISITDLETAYLVPVDCSEAAENEQTTSVFCITALL